MTNTKDAAILTETSRTQMHRSVWSYLNRVLPSTCTDADIDAVTEAFIAAGLQAIGVFLATPTPSAPVALTVEQVEAGAQL